MLENLRFIFGCKTYKQLAKALNVPYRTLAGWSASGIPADKKGLLELIYKQQKRIKELESEKIFETHKTGGTEL